ncbi:unnamed protein product [Absidia cylindrospora]
MSSLFYQTSFSTNGITQLESLAQLSMQDYNSLGIVSIQDRKKLFQLVQSLRQELPTKENGLVSTTAHYSYRRQTRPTSTGINSSPSMAQPSSFMDSSSIGSGSSGLSSLTTSGVTGMPDLSALTMSRRPASNNGSSQYQSSQPSTPPLQQQQQQQQQQMPTPTSTVTRSRSRTLPDQHQRPDFMKTTKAAHPPQPLDPFINRDQAFDDEEDEEDMPEIRRGSNPLLNPYGIPVQNNNNNNGNGNKLLRSPFAQQQRSPMATSATIGNSNANTNSSNNSSNTTGLGQSDLNQKIRVCVRKRPLNRKELERGEKDISPTAGIRSININEPKMKVDLTKYIEQHSFTFDDVFDVDDSNDQIYQRTAQPLVKYVFNGGKATCFAYGQTGSGKTYTMLDPKHGLYVLAARDVFSLLCQPQYQHLSAYIGFYEIYQGQLYDLLNARKKLFAREDGKQNVVIAGLKEYVIKNVDDLMKVFEYGSQCRSTGSTGANSDSSRSHAILQILLKPTKNKKIITGKLSFIDLAGSERGADRGETDVKTRMEGAEINKSLLALKECIRALDLDKRHTPFRQSKLTQVLKDSFVGHSRTCMIATISPNQGNSEHTLNTLRYADRVKELKGERDRRGQGDSAPSSARPSEPNPLDGGDEMDDYVANVMVDGDTYGSSSNNNNNNINSNCLDYDDHDGYSDDPELYHEDDDDLFLGDEDFPSDGDVHILDEDFPHETNLHDSSNNDDEQDSGEDPSSSSSVGLLRQRFFDDDDDDSFSSNIPKRQPTPYHRPPLSNEATPTTAGGLAQHRSLIAPNNDQQQRVGESDYQQTHLHLSGSPSGNNDNDIHTARSRQSSSGDRRRSADRSSTNTHTSRTSVPSPRQHYQQLQSQQQQHQQHQSNYQQRQQQQQQQLATALSYDSDPTIMFDPEAIEEFIKFHRAEIRETGECSKRETKLLTHFSLNMASRKDDDYDMMDSSSSSSAQQQQWLRQHKQQQDADKTMTDFQGYLNDLGEVLEMKMAAIDALRDRIRVMLGEEDDEDVGRF